LNGGALAAQKIAQSAAQATTNFQNATAAVKPLSEQIGRSIVAGDLVSRVVQAGEKPLAPGAPAIGDTGAATTQPGQIAAPKLTEQLTAANQPAAQLQQFADKTKQAYEGVEELPVSLGAVIPTANQLSVVSGLTRDAFATVQQQFPPALQTALTTANALAQAANQIANSFERAAQASEKLGGGSATNAASGGLIRRFEAGGFAPQGTDTIPAMLSPGEFVVNAKSTRQWFSQLQAINAGVQPIYREQGGPVTTNNTFGNITVNGGGDPTVAADKIIAQINRATRRGTGKLKK
jgi:hypothetical protein